jgi:hypothetical protein
MHEDNLQWVLKFCGPTVEGCLGAFLPLYGEGRSHVTSL